MTIDIIDYETNKNRFLGSISSSYVKYVPCVSTSQLTELHPVDRLQPLKGFNFSGRSVFDQKNLAFWMPSIWILKLSALSPLPSYTQAANMLWMGVMRQMNRNQSKGHAPEDGKVTLVYCVFCLCLFSNISSAHLTSVSVVLLARWICLLSLLQIHFISSLAIMDTHSSRAPAVMVSLTLASEPVHLRTWMV